MTFNLLNLKNNFAAGDTQYITDFNNNFTNINSMFAGVRGDVDLLGTQQGQKILEDLLRVIDPINDPIGGVVGPYSLVLDLSTTDTVKLVHQNSDLYSYVYIGNDRYQTDAVLELAMDNAANNTISSGYYYVGVTGNSSTGAVEIKVSQTATDVGLRLYKFLFTNNSGSPNTMTLPQREPRSILFSNTMLQRMLETPQSIYTKNSAAVGAVGSSAEMIGNIILPHSHRLHSMAFAKTGESQNNPNWGGNLRLKLKNALGDIAAGTTLIDVAMPTTTAVGTYVTANYSYNSANIPQMSFPATTQYEVEIERGSGTGQIAEGIEMIINYVPTYEAPTTN